MDFRDDDDSFDGAESVEKPRRRGKKLRTENEADSSFTPCMLHPAWEKWSLPVALAIQAGEDTVEKIVSAGKGMRGVETDLDMPGFRLRNCLAWLEMAGVVYYVRGTWKLAPYGVKWLSMNAKKE